MTHVSHDTAAPKLAPAVRPRLDRLLRWREVQPLVGVSRTTWWRLMRSGAAPAPHRISAGCIGWLEGEIAAFQAARAPSKKPGVDAGSALSSHSADGRVIHG